MIRPGMERRKLAQKKEKKQARLGEEGNPIRTEQEIEILPNYQRYIHKPETAIENETH